jgi:hypothetical protein
MSDHIFGYWDEPLGKESETPHTASEKSLNDRDGVDIWHLQDATHIHNGDDISDWDATLMDGLDDEQFPMKEWARPDDVVFHSMSQQEENDFVEFLQSDEYVSWQEEIAIQEKIGDFRETKEKRFYGVVRVKKADLISPSESELMSYYIDYGYNTIEEVIKDMGEEEMLREWYVNTNFTSEFVTHREDHNISYLDWDSESEEVEAISEDEWNDLKKYTW